MVRAQHRSLRRIPAATDMERLYDKGTIPVSRQAISFRLGDDWKDALLAAGIIDAEGKAADGEMYVPRLKRKYSDKYLLGLIREVADMLGRLPTTADMHRLWLEGKMPAVSNFYVRFKSWKGALAAAGLEAGGIPMTRPSVPPKK